MSENITTKILRWYSQHGRADLPWRQNISAYRVWISEIMLQQTQVTTVIPYFLRFMTRFPDINALASASLDEVLKHWAGLGYYSRARNLHASAKIIMKQWNGTFPTNFSDVIELPGIGRSTAGAILSIAYHQALPILDGNVKRVLSRLHAITEWPGAPKVQTRLWELATQYTPVKSANDYTQAIMDFGATLCTRAKPRCTECPLQKKCMAYLERKTGEIPASRPKRSIPTKETFALIIMDDKNRLFLEKRPPTGIWGGLWSFPQCPPELDPISWCYNTYGISITPLRNLDILQHTFSHFHLLITPVVAQLTSLPRTIMDRNDQIWYDANQLQTIGTPSPIKRLLSQMGF